jgi:hypothetical protein
MSVSLASLDLSAGRSAIAWKTDFLGAVTSHSLNAMRAAWLLAANIMQRLRR